MKRFGCKYCSPKLICHFVIDSAQNCSFPINQHDTAWRTSRPNWDEFSHKCASVKQIMAPALTDWGNDRSELASFCAYLWFSLIISRLHRLSSVVSGYLAGGSAHPLSDGQGRCIMWDCSSIWMDPINYSVGHPNVSCSGPERANMEKSDSFLWETVDLMKPKCLIWCFCV